MSIQEIKLSELSYDAETRAGLMLAFFWEPLDSNCRKERERIKKAIEEIGEQIKVGICSVETSPELAERLGVKSIPTTILLKEGKERERLVGLQHEGTLIRHLRRYLETEA